MASFILLLIKFLYTTCPFLILKHLAQCLTSQKSSPTCFRIDPLSCWQLTKQTTIIRNAQPPQRETVTPQNMVTNRPEREGAPTSVRHDTVQEEGHESEACLNGRCMFLALGCCFTGCDFDNIMLCSKGNLECLCMTHEHCLAANHDALGIGLLRSDDSKECCKLGMFCCTCGCKVPEVICKGVTQFLCLVQAQALPLDKDNVTVPVCALCCYTCSPEPMGCVEPYPESEALNKITEFTTPASEVITRQ